MLRFVAVPMGHLLKIKCSVCVFNFMRMITINSKNQYLSGFLKKHTEHTHNNFLLMQSIRIIQLCVYMLSLRCNVFCAHSSYAWNTKRQISGRTMNRIKFCFPVSKSPTQICFVDVKNLKSKILRLGTCSLQTYYVCTVLHITWRPDIQKRIGMYESITVIAPLVLTGIDSKAPCR